MPRREGHRRQIESKSNVENSNIPFGANIQISETDDELSGAAEQHVEVQIFLRIRSREREKRSRGDLWRVRRYYEQNLLFVLQILLVEAYEAQGKRIIVSFELSHIENNFFYL